MLLHFEKISACHTLTSFLALFLALPHINTAYLPLLWPVATQWKGEFAEIDILRKISIQCVTAHKFKHCRSHWSRPVLSFSKLNKIFFGYLDPENIFLDDKNK